MLRTDRTYVKHLAVATIAAILMEFILPLTARALTSGPAQPEFASFEPVATTGMVNEFTGQFTYNLPVLQVPGANGGGYAMSLAYHSGVRGTEDASWTGFGWNISPGYIMRGKRGFPDDYRNAEVTYYNKQKTNETFTAGLSLMLDIFSIKDDGKDSQGNKKKDEDGGGSFLGALGLSCCGVNTALRYNNYRGFSFLQSYSLSSDILGILSYNIDAGIGKFDFQPRLPKLFEADFSVANAKKNYDESVKKTSFEGLTEIQRGIVLAKLKNNAFRKEGIRAENHAENLQNNANSMYRGAVSYGLHFLSIDKMPVNTLEYEGDSFDFSLGLEGTAAPALPGEVGVLAGAQANYTWQRGIGTQNENVYGYLYSGDAESPGDIMDYFVEKEAPYTKKDLFLGIPFANADHFGVAGEGLNGGFRLYNQGLGSFRPNYKRSKIGMYTGGLEVGVGTAIGLGAALSAGEQTLTVGAWQGSQDASQQFRSQEDAGEPFFFRFAGDYGGELQYGTGDGARRAEVESKSPDISQPQTDLFELVNNGARPGRSSYIAYHTNREMMETLGSVHYQSYTKDSALLHHYIDRLDAGIADGIGEITVFNHGGMRYNYGLPVYARNERNLQFSPDYSASHGNPFNTHLYQRHQENSSDYYNGEVRRQPYASMFLLTDICSADYLDRTGDGPTPDDFGGYTRFNYIRSAGSRTKSGDDSGKEWYKWRSPYRGLHFSPGNLISGIDDQGAVASGEKEIYLLSSVETKTHIAYFITNKTCDTIQVNQDSTLILKGSGRERYDAYEAYRDEASDDENELRSSGGAFRPTFTDDWQTGFAGKKFNNTSLDDQKPYIDSSIANKNRYLERIELYARNSDGTAGELIKTVHFEYDYSLFYVKHKKPWYEVKDKYQNVIDTFYHKTGDLNSAYGYTSDGVLAEHAEDRVAMWRLGKLTLKRVWMEYNGVVSARIAPYTFEYEYKVNQDGEKDYADNIVGRYPEVVGAMNPVWDDTNAVGSKRYENPAFEEGYFDRWGDYRPNGYAFSKKYFPYADQNPSSRYDPAPWHLKAIVLPSGGEIHVQYERNDYSYVQNRPAMAMVRLDTMLIDEPLIGKNSYKCYLDVKADLGIDESAHAEELKELRNKIAAMFHVPNFIGVLNGQAQKPDVEKIYFKFLYALLDCDIDLDTKTFPREGAEYIRGYTNVSDVGIDERGLFITIRSEITPVDLAHEFAKAHKIKSSVDCGAADWDMASGNLSGPEWYEFLRFVPGVEVLLQGINELFNKYETKPYYNFSYLRIPLTRPKLGGGARVKRLLMYDRGMESGDAVLYGTEYRYEMMEGGKLVSSGVATNEPFAGRDENSLVKYLRKREDRSAVEEIIAGRDLEQFEGPLGESLLPAPSIGYARVVTRNIHSGKTGTGYGISEFYTARDFPLKGEWTTIDREVDSPNPIYNILNIAVTSHHRLSQGYAFTTNDFHGKPRRIMQCAGSYDAANEQHEVVSSREISYYEPGEKVWLYNGAGAALTEGRPGREMEVVMDSRRIHDLNYNLKLNFDAGFTVPSVFVLPLPFGTFSFQHTYESKKLNTHVITKVINYPAIMKSVEILSEGIRHREHYVAFSPETGSAVITLNDDAYAGLDLEQSAEHIGTYAGYSFPASQLYPAMGQKALNERLRVAGATYSSATGTIGLPGGSGDFYAGDLVRMIKTSPADTGLVHVTAAAGGSLTVQPLSYADISGFSGVVSLSDLQVIRSGRSNQLDLMAGSLTTYGRDTAVILSGETLDTLSSGVIAAAAQTFSDDWDYNETDYGSIDWGSVNDATDYEKGFRGRWRPSKAYVYRTGVASAVAGAADRVYTNAGVFEDFSFFSWDESNVPAKWLALNTIKQYSPHGEALEEENLLGIPSAARFAHSGQLPNIVAGNANYGSLVFESFEDKEGGNVTSLTAHAGERSFHLPDAAWHAVDSLTAGQRLRESGLLVKFWARAHASPPCNVKVGTSIVAPELVSQVGYWKLWTARIDPDVLPSSSATRLEVSFQKTGGETYIDDVRAQPLDAQAACFVYEPATLRLSAQFDDQHYGLYFQYNGEGQLVRRIKETARGRKTVQEAQYHVPLSERPPEGASVSGILSAAPASLPAHLRSNSGWRNPQFGHSLKGTDSAGGAIDILRIDIGADKRELKLFGGDSLRTPDKDATGKQLKDKSGREERQ